ncbi:FUSC family protein [Nocardiopsis alba]|uniref:FUSC family protein n=1 Tax=Nocardiopsis alba TaxID=53437 RepID=UPI0033EDC89C
MNYFSSLWGRRADLFDVRGALVPRRVRGNVLVTAVRAGGCLALVLVSLRLTGRMDLAPYAAMGCFTSLYARDETYARRVWLLAVVGVGLTVAVAAGASASALGVGVWAPILVVAAVASGARYLSEVVALGAPAGLMFVFAAGVAGYAPRTWPEVGVSAGVTAAAAGLCWAAAVVGALAHPRAPERLALARALHAVADHLEDPSGRGVHRAEGAVRSAWRVLHARERGEGTRGLEVLAARAQGAIRGGPVVERARRAAELREVARRVRRRRVVDPLVEEGERVRLSAYADRVRAGARPVRVWSWGRASGAWVVRVAVASVVAGGVAWLWGLGHGYWATVSAASVLQVAGVSATWHRTVQRGVGTVVGAVVAVGVFALVDISSVWVVIALVVACQVGAELVVMTNYAYAIVCVTPLTLALSALARPGEGTFDLVVERTAATVLGAVVGLVVCVVVADRGARARLEGALGECERACARVSACGGAGCRHRLVEALGDVEAAVAVAVGEPAVSVPGERVERVRGRARALLDREPV